MIKILERFKNKRHARYHTADPVTSVEAADQLTTGLSDQKSILAAHYERDLLDPYYTGLADYQSADLAGIDHWNARKRCHELREQGLIRFTGESRVNPASGRPNAVSVLTAAGARVSLKLLVDAR
jgi:hypothetical protein